MHPIFDRTSYYIRCTFKSSIRNNEIENMYESVTRLFDLINKEYEAQRRNH
jgi:hypothetical protein